MKRRGFLLVWVVPALTACDSGDAAQRSELDFGELALDLVASDPEGHRYRLRNAQFEVHLDSSSDAGVQRPVVLNSEDDPASDTLGTRLLEGRYRVILREGWYMERTDLAPPTRVDALLLGSAARSVFVRRQSRSSVFFDFGVGGDRLDFFGGDLNVRIGIQTPEFGDGGVPARPPGDAGVPRDVGPRADAMPPW